MPAATDKKSRKTSSLPLSSKRAAAHGECSSIKRPPSCPPPALLRNNNQLLQRADESPPSNPAALASSAQVRPRASAVQPVQREARDPQSAKHDGVGG